MSRCVLITGATGCVGRAVAQAAMRQGWHVRGLARTTPAEWPGEWRDSLDLRLGSITDAAAVQAATRDCDAVVHLAGYVHRIPQTQADLDELRASIVDGTRIVARTACGEKARLIVASTVAVYGSTPPSQCDESCLPHPDTPYAKAKLEAEVLVQDIDKRALILRIAAVYGPYDRGSFARLIRTVERRLSLYAGDGHNRKSLLFADNLAERILKTTEMEETT